MMALGIGVITIIIGYLLSIFFSGLGTSNAYMSYVNACTNAVLFLAGIVSIWGYLILQELKKSKNNDNESK